MGFLEKVECIASAFQQMKSYQEDKKRATVTNRILRYAEEAQGKTPGAVPLTMRDLAEFGIINPKETDMAAVALGELFEKGFLEYSDGYYYLKGRAPRFVCS